MITSHEKLLFSNEFFPKLGQSNFRGNLSVTISHL